MGPTTSVSTTVNPWSGKVKKKKEAEQNAITYIALHIDSKHGYW